MNLFEQMYQEKERPNKVSAFLENFLLFEIYSPAVLRLAQRRWAELPFYVKDSVHPEVQELIQKADAFSATELQKKINAFTIVRAINVLLAYKNCPIPLTKRTAISAVKKNLLSARGEWALKRLLYGASHGEWSEGLAELALRTSHKFLMDLAYYKQIQPTLKEAESFFLRVYKKDQEPKEVFYYFPIIQLTQGCLNHCSHCFCDAKNQLSFMPYPLWRGLYEGLDKYYKYYEGLEWEKKSIQKAFFFKKEKTEIHKALSPFSRFFHDSDISQYHDAIMNVDGGDIALFLAHNRGQCYFLTKGITNPLSRRAIAKASKVEPIDLSFVDTPKENMDYNIRQLKKTIQLIHSVPMNKGVRYILHTHLKTPSVLANEIFKEQTIIHQEIVPSGRANQFPKSELLSSYHDDLYPFTINPNGDLILPSYANGKYHQEKRANLFKIGKERA